MFRLIMNEFIIVFHILIIYIILLVCKDILINYSLSII